MPDQIGSLVVSVSADTASLTTDLGRAVGSMNLFAGQATQSLQGVGSLFSQLDQQVQKFGISLGALGGIAAGAGFGALVTSTANAEVSLLHLAQRVGTTVDALSQLVPAARQTDTSMEEVATSSAKLSKTLLDGGAAGEKATSVLAALGFTSQQIKGFIEQPATAMYDIGKALNALPDSGVKAATAMALFGKAGADLLPFLKTLGEQTQLNTTLTTAQATQAEAYKTQLTNLELEVSKVAVLNVSALLPSLTSIAAAFVVANANAGGTPAIMNLAGAALKILALGAETAYTGLKNLAELGVAAGTIAFDLLQKDTKGATAAMKTLETQTVSNSHELLAFYTTLQSGAKTQETATQAQSANAQVTAAQAAQLAALKAALLSAGGTKGTGDGAGASFINSLQAQYDTLGLTGTALDAYKARMLGVLPEVQDLLQALDEANTAWALGTAEQKENDAENQVYIDLGHQREAATNSATASLDALLQKTKEETSALGLSDAERQKAIALLQLEHDKALLTAAAYEQYKADINEAFDQKNLTEASIKAGKDVAQQWKTTADSIDSSLTNALYDGFKKGASFGQDLANFLEQTFKKLVLQPLLQPISGSLAGLAFPGGASAAGVGSIPGLGNLISQGSSLVSSVSGAIDGATGGLYGSFATGATGQLLGLSSVAADGFGPPALTAVGTALPVVAAIAGIALLVSSFLKKGGGPKSGGDAQSAGGTDARYFTPSDQDSQLQALVGSQDSTYASALAGLGGTGSAVFHSGYSTDPQGTASDNVHASAYVNGQQVYDQQDPNIGRDSATTAADLSLAAQRAVLAALQASSLPKAVAQILDSVTASTASSTQITNVIALGTAFQTVTTLMARSPVADALAAIGASSQTATGALNAQITASKTLTSAFDGSAASSAKLAASANAIYSAEVAVISQAEGVKLSLGQLFADTIKNFTLSSLSTAGKQAYYAKDEANLNSQLATATDPSQIQSLTQSIIADLNASFQLLTPQQQAAQLAQYTAQVNTLNAASSARLTAVETTAQNTANAALTGIQTAITAAATTMQAAGVAIQTGGTAIQNAANTPVTVDVTITQQGTEITGGS